MCASRGIDPRFGRLVGQTASPQHSDPTDEHHYCTNDLHRGNHVQVRRMRTSRQAVKLKYTGKAQGQICGPGGACDALRSSPPKCMGRRTQCGCVHGRRDRERVKETRSGSGHGRLPHGEATRDRGWRRARGGYSRGLERPRGRTQRRFERMGTSVSPERDAAT